MLQNPGFILQITPLAPAALKVVLLLRSSRVEFLTSPEIFDSLLAAQSSLTKLKNAIITMRPRARSELLSVALLDPIALSLSSFLVKALAHGSVMMCENTRSLPKALLQNWRRSLSVPSSAKTGPQFSFRAQPPRLPGDLSVLRSHDHQLGTLGFRTLGFILGLPVPRTEHILLRLPH